MLYTLFVAAAAAYSTAYLIKKQMISADKVIKIPEEIKNKVIKEINKTSSNTTKQNGSKNDAE